MSSPAERAAFFSRLAPQLDAHMMLILLDFFRSQGLDVADAHSKVLGSTSLFEHPNFPIQKNELKKRVTQQVERDAKLGAIISPILHEYFDCNPQQGWLLKESEALLKKANTEDLTIRTYEQPEKFSAEPRPRGVTKEAYERQLKELHYGEEYPQDGSVVTETAGKKVEVRIETVSARDESGKFVQREQYEVYVYQARGRISTHVFDALVEMATILHDAGRYKEAAEVLKFCRIVADDENPKFASVLWGLLACTICSSMWATAKQTIEDIRTYVTKELGEDIDFKSRNEISNVTCRNWLLHWGLFVFFKGGETMSSHYLDIVFDNANRSYHMRQQSNQNVVDSVSPHLLRYLAAACVLNRTKRSALYGTLRMIKGCYEYRDALTDFIELLAGQANFEKALATIPKIAELVEGDYFLSGLKANIVDGAWKLTFEHYIRTHRTVSIETVARRMYASETPAGEKIDSSLMAQAEVWIANLIRETKVVAKIDSVGGKVEVSSGAQSIHQRVYDKLSQIDRIQIH